MNSRAVAFVYASLTWLAACGPSVPEPRSGDQRLAEVGGGEPGGGGGGGVGGDVGRALSSERARLAELDEELEGNEDDEAIVRLRRDRIARASFIAHLERCAEDAAACPPRLDEPTVPSEWDPALGELKGAFAADAGAWPDAARELAASACGCRTATCAEWVLAELERWEAGLDARAEDEAAEEVTLTRACAWSRLGRD